MGQVVPPLTLWLPSHRQSVEYTQESMDNAVGRISSVCPDLGGCDLLGLLRSIYSTPLLQGHPRQVSGAKGEGNGCKQWGKGRVQGSG